MRTARVLLVLLLAAVIYGCAQIETVKTSLPIKHALQLDRLVVYSDFELGPDHRLLNELVQQRIELARLLALPPSSEPVRVYLFDSEPRYQEFMRLHYPDLPTRRAFFMQTDTRLVVYAYWGDRVGEDLRHEVTHGYLHAVLPEIPIWLDEGLAESFEIAPHDGDVHRSHLELLQKLIAGGWRPNLARLEGLTRLEQMSQLEYAESWAWVHLLLHTTHERREILAGYLRALQQRSDVEPLSTRLYRNVPNADVELVRHLQSLAR